MYDPRIPRWNWVNKLLDKLETIAWQEDAEEQED